MQLPADDSSAPRFCVLGPIRAWTTSGELNLGPHQRRAVLALLLARAGDPVAIAELVDLIWPQQPPPTAVNIVHRHIGELRRLLEPDLPPRAEGTLLRRHSTGYRFGGPPGALDLDRFRELVDRAQRTRDITAFAGAFALVAGPCAAEHRLGPVPHPAFSSVDAEVTAAVRAATDLVAARRDAELLLPALRTLAERDVSDDMGAALSALLNLVSPGTDDSGLTGNPAYRLPAAPASFFSRQPGLRGMDAVLDDVPRAARLLAISGMPGLGKTALALRWAHRVAGYFPDGQIFLDLRGSRQDAGRLTPPDAITLLLDALGVPASQIPPGYQAQVGLYRSTVAGRRLLFVFDDTRDAGHVLDLLPGAPGTAAVVTSRNWLGELAVRGAHQVVPDLLGAMEGGQLLRHLVGEARFAAASSWETVISDCGGLPLAISLVANKVATGGNTALQDADLDHIFAGPYDSLSTEAQRLLGAVARRGNSVQVKAPIEAATARLVREVSAAGLLLEQRPGQFSLHKLVRAFVLRRWNG
jgi:hypothetical protein